jgi:hypothetical protein
VYAFASLAILNAALNSTSVVWVSSKSHASCLKFFPTVLVLSGNASLFCLVELLLFLVDTFKTGSFGPETLVVHF